MDPIILMPLLATLFLSLGVRRLISHGGRMDPRAKAWLITGALFAAVSGWLVWQR